MVEIADLIRLCLREYSQTHPGEKVDFSEFVEFALPVIESEFPSEEFRKSRIKTEVNRLYRSRELYYEGEGIYRIQELRFTDSKIHDSLSTNAKQHLAPNQSESRPPETHRQSSRLEVRVEAPDTEPISGVHVSIETEGVNKQTKTGPEGKFVVKIDDLGKDINLTFSKTGYQDHQRTVSVQGFKRRLRIQLEPEENQETEKEESSLIHDSDKELLSEIPIKELRKNVLYVGGTTESDLIQNGYDSLQDIEESSRNELLTIPSIDSTTVDAILKYVDERAEGFVQGVESPDEESEENSPRENPSDILSEIESEFGEFDSSDSQ